jgi:hypothetical protein
MNRGHRRSAKLPAESVGRGRDASIDLGMALSVYGKDGAGKLVELQAGDAQEPCWYGFSLSEASPTEQ